MESQRGEKLIYCIICVVFLSIIQFGLYADSLAKEPYKIGAVLSITGGQPFLVNLKGILV